MYLRSRSLTKCWFTGDKKISELQEAEAEVASLQAQVQAMEQQIYQDQIIVAQGIATLRDKLSAVTLERDALIAALTQLQPYPEYIASNSISMNSISMNGQPAGVGGLASSVDATRATFHSNQSGYPSYDREDTNNCGARRF